MRGVASIRGEEMPGSAGLIAFGLGSLTFVFVFVPGPRPSSQVESQGISAGSSVHEISSLLLLTTIQAPRSFTYASAGSLLMHRWFICSSPHMNNSHVILAGKLYGTIKSS
jgi:hypothetical protein